MIMMRRLLAALFGCLLFAGVHHARAAEADLWCYAGGSPAWQPCNASTPLSTNGGFGTGNYISGDSGAVTGATNTQVIAAQAASIKIYMTGWSCANTGASTSLVTFTSGSGGATLAHTILPAGGGSNIGLTTPVPTAAATALYMTTATGSTSMYCTVFGYIGP